MKKLIQICVVVGFVGLMCGSTSGQDAEVKKNVTKLKETGNCQKCNLWFANLSQANLFRENLNYADLIGANLLEANMTGANLNGSNLSGEIFYTLKEATIMIEKWRVHYNTKRPHTSLGYRPPAPETIQIPNTIMTYEN